MTSSEVTWPAHPFQFYRFLNSKSMRRLTTTTTFSYAVFFGWSQSNEAASSSSFPVTDVIVIIIPTELYHAQYHSGVVSRTSSFWSSSVSVHQFSRWSSLNAACYVQSLICPSQLSLSTTDDVISRNWKHRRPWLRSFTFRCFFGAVMTSTSSGDKLCNQFLQLEPAWFYSNTVTVSAVCSACYSRFSYFSVDLTYCTWNTVTGCSAVKSLNRIITLLYGCNAVITVCRLFLTLIDKSIKVMAKDWLGTDCRLLLTS